jgi:hypothetical protein
MNQVVRDEVFVKLDSSALRQAQGPSGHRLRGFQNLPSALRQAQGPSWHRVGLAETLITT